MRNTPRSEDDRARETEYTPIGRECSTMKMTHYLPDRVLMQFENTTNGGDCVKTLKNLQSQTRQLKLRKFAGREGGSR